MKTFHYLSLFVVGILTVFLFSGFLSFNKGNKETQPKQSIALLPIDKAVGRPLTAYVGRKFGESFMEKAFGDKINLEFLKGSDIHNDPHYVQKRIYVTIGKTLRRRKYEVLDPVKVFAAFNTLAYRHQEVNLKQLREQVPADAYFFVTITYWETDDFDKTGIMEAGYNAQLLDGKTEKLIWQKESPKRRFTVRQNQNNISSFTAYYDEAIELIALDIIKKFPKKIPVSEAPKSFEVQAQKVTTT